MTAIDDLVQEFWRTSSDGLVGASFFPMRRLLEILQGCFRSFKVCFDIISVFAETVPSFTIAISRFNIFLFAVVFCLFWTDPMPLTISGRFFT